MNLTLYTVTLSRLLLDFSDWHAGYKTMNPTAQFYGVIVGKFD